MAIGPVQLIVLGFNHPEFHGEIIAELERLRESGTVRVIDALAVHKDAAGEIEVRHLSNLTDEEAIELGSTVGALIGLGIEGEEGMEAGARRGRRSGRRARRARVLGRGRLGRPRGNPQRFGRRAPVARTPLGGSPPRRDHACRGFPHQRRLHQSARPDRGRAGVRRGSRSSSTRWRQVPRPRVPHSPYRDEIGGNEMLRTRRVARRTTRRTARRRRR